MSEVFSIDVTVEERQLKEVLSSFLHTIIFHRAFGQIKGEEVECDYIGISYVRYQDARVVRLVEDKAEHFAKSLATKKSPRGQIGLVFLDKQPKKKLSLAFGKEDKSFCFEQWNISITVVPNNTGTGEGEKLQDLLEREVAQQLAAILRIVNTKVTHIPMVRNQKPLPFHFEISEPGASGDSWSDLFRRVLVDTNTSSGFL